MPDDSLASEQHPDHKKTLWHRAKSSLL